AEREETRRLFLAFEVHDFGSLAEADDARDVERARTHAALVTAAIHLRDEADAGLAAANVESADALRAVHLVRGDAREVGVHLLNVELDLADALHRVGVEEHALLARDLADLFERLDGADLVVREHDAHEDRLVRDGALDVVRIDATVTADAEVGHAEAVLFEA